MYNFDEYCFFYESRGYLPLNHYSPKNKKLNAKQLKTKYEKYVRSIEKKKLNRNLQIHKSYLKKYIPTEREKLHKIKNDELQDICMKRANNRCEIWPLLTAEERAYLKPMLFKETLKLDIMHVVGRSNNSLKYDPKNIVIGTRILHSMIDSYHNFLGKPITAIQRDELWIRIIGKERWEYLQANK